MADTEKSENSTSKFVDNLHIYGLLGIAIAYPIFNFLRVNPAYLLVNGVSPEQLIIIISIIVFVLPTIVVVLESELSRWSTTLARAVHLVGVAILVALSFCPLVSRIHAFPFWLSALLVLLLIGIVVREICTSRFAYIALALLAPVSLLITINFVRNHNIQQFLELDRNESIDWKAEENELMAPVVMVVFDAFPLIHLLDADGGIDKGRFPNFATLADESTWYSNATTVQDLTLKSIPAMLTGIFPKPGPVMPRPENYTTSLFDALQYYYRIHALEMSTDMAGVGLNNVELKSIANKILLTDLTIFYLRSLLPNHTANEWLPLDEDVCGGFLERMPDKSTDDWNDLQKWQHENQVAHDIDARKEVAANFVDEIESYSGNTFHFVHVMLPHPPYQYLPNGMLYNYDVDQAIPYSTRVHIERASHIL